MLRRDAFEYEKITTAGSRRDRSPKTSTSRKEPFLTGAKFCCDYPPHDPLLGDISPKNSFHRICTARRFTRCWLSSTKCQATGTAFVVEAGPQKIGSQLTQRWREMDSNFRFRARRNQEISVSRWTVARISAEPSGRHAREQYRQVLRYGAEVRFATDSLVEGDGFEISVPGRERVGRLAE
jgi:hypothetical protein